MNEDQEKFIQLMAGFKSNDVFISDLDTDHSQRDFKPNPGSQPESQPKPQKNQPKKDDTHPAH